MNKKQIILNCKMVHNYIFAIKGNTEEHVKESHSNSVSYKLTKR